MRGECTANNGARGVTQCLLLAAGARFSSDKLPTEGGIIHKFEINYCLLVVDCFPSVIYTAPALWIHPKPVRRMADACSEI